MSSEERSVLNIVLHEPEIPQNTGNIARTCVLTNSTLHLIKPLGFSLSEKQVRRSGLDYWDDLKLFIYEDWDDFLKQNPMTNYYLATTKTTNNYSDYNYKYASLEEPVYFIFGKESKGLPSNIRDNADYYPVRIPMLDIGRSLNLSNSVAIIIYEALRQLGFNALV